MFYYHNITSMCKIRSITVSQIQYTVWPLKGIFKDVAMLVFPDGLGRRFNLEITNEKERSILYRIICSKINRWLNCSPAIDEVVMMWRIKSCKLPWIQFYSKKCQFDRSNPFGSVNALRPSGTSSGPGKAVLLLERRWDQRPAGGSPPVWHSSQLPLGLEPSW